MNFIKKVKPLAILSIFLLFTFHSYAQFVENVKKMVTRKAQITVLNTTIDSLKSEAKNKDSALQEEQEQTHDLNVQLTDLNTKLEQSEKKKQGLGKGNINV
jgi:predicted  nucleic acid-binding Zn-ribbon protein